MPEIREALMSVGSGSWCLNCSKLSLSFPVLRNWVWPAINLSDIKRARWNWKSSWDFIRPDSAGRDGRSLKLTAREIPLVFGL